MKRLSQQGWRYLFIALWVIASIFFGWQLRQPPYSFNSQWGAVNLGLTLLCTIALLFWIPSPIRSEPDETPDRDRLFTGLLFGSALLLFVIQNGVGRAILFVLPVIAIIVLILLKRPVEKREGIYALALALIAGVTGLGANWITFIPPIWWGILQVVLVLTSFLAGWGILQATGLRRQGVGISRFLSEGPMPALRSFLSGLLIAMPWAFSNVLLGSENGETWVKSWWQPIIALQPGIAEEAWGRILMVPLFFLLFRRASGPRAAFGAALYVVAYWFAYLHTPGGMEGIVPTVILGTLYILPVSYLCLYRDLETAIGWHFWVDFVKYAVALIVLN